MSLVIGVLLPASMMFPAVDQALLAGLEGAVADLDPPPRLVIEPVGTATQVDLVGDKIQRLLLAERPHVIVGVLGAALVPHVRKFVDQHRTPFIVCNLGADLLNDGGTPQQSIFLDSLNLWQSTYALGAWAASHAGRSVAVAAALHESGFGIVNAFYRAFVERGGGDVAAIEITHRASAVEDPADALARLADVRPDFVFGLYSGREGVSFMQARANSALAGVPLLTTAMMLHGHWLPQMADQAIGVRTACSWAPGSWPDEEARFARASTARGARPAPDVWALLGYEAGLIVRAAVARLGHAPASAADLLEAIPGVEFTSPRGRLRIDPVLREVITVDHHIEIVADAAGEPVWRGAGALDLPADYHADAAEMRAIEAKSGWVNPYLVN